jgi:hypothetical protein
MTNSENLCRKPVDIAGLRQGENHEIEIVISVTPPSEGKLARKGINYESQQGCSDA